jgi:hypothetical protein
MRRLASLVLIGVSLWLLYQTMWRVGGFQEADIVRLFEREIGHPTFFFPAFGGVLGLLGGLVAFFGGPGGAVIALIGGVVAAGFGLYGGPALWTGDWYVWKNPTLVSVAMLAIGGMVAILGRR